MKLFFLVMFFQSAVPVTSQMRDDGCDSATLEQIDFLQDALRSTQRLLDESDASTRDQSVHSSGQIQALNDLIDQLRRIPENQELFEVFDGVQSLDDLSLDDLSPEELCGGREDGRTDRYVRRFNSCMELGSGDGGIRGCMSWAGCVPVGMSYQELYPERYARDQEEEREMEERMREHMEESGRDDVGEIEQIQEKKKKSRIDAE